jgi:hypothetical protein
LPLGKLKPTRDSRRKPSCHPMPALTPLPKRTWPHRLTKLGPAYVSERTEARWCQATPGRRPIDRGSSSARRAGRAANGPPQPTSDSDRRRERPGKSRFLRADLRPPLCISLTRAFRRSFLSELRAFSRGLSESTRAPCAPSGSVDQLFSWTLLRLRPSNPVAMNRR